MYKAPTVLVILDGFGYSTDVLNNPIAQAKTTVIPFFYKHYPSTFLAASGKAVGLPDGYIGNSEVGHLTLGMGRVIEQSVTILNRMIADGTFFTHPVLSEKLSALAKTGKKLHIMGLLSDAGVHAHIDHMIAYIKAARIYGVKKIIVHPFLDGRDVAPQSASIYLQKIEKELAKEGVFGSVQGRKGVMDRVVWTAQERDQIYSFFTECKKPDYETWRQALEYFYNHNQTDEYIVPTMLSSDACIQNGDGVIVTNFRSDRASQLVSLLCNNKSEKNRLSLLFLITPVLFGPNFLNDFLVPIPILKNSLKEVLSDNKASILTISDAEKYAAVSYFFDGYHSQKYPKECRVIIRSDSDVINHPQMSALEITRTVLESLDSQLYDFYLINYANADMVGHTGSMNATIKAIECLDTQLGLLYKNVVQKYGGTLYITADHGKAELLYDTTTDQPRTAHTSNPVPFFVINKQLFDVQFSIPCHQLSDVAPYILGQLGISVPVEMK